MLLNCPRPNLTRPPPPLPRPRNSEEKQQTDAEAGFIVFVVSSEGHYGSCPGVASIPVAGCSAYCSDLGMDNRVGGTAKYVDRIGSVAPDAVSGAVIYCEAIHHFSSM